MESVKPGLMWACGPHRPPVRAGQATDEFGNYLGPFMKQPFQPLPDSRGSEAYAEPRALASGPEQLATLFHDGSLGLANYR